MQARRIITCLLLCCTTPAIATDPDIESSVAWGPGRFANLTLLVVPDGSGPTLYSSHTSTGAVADGTITVQLLDTGGYPVVGFPADRMRLDWRTGTYARCDNGTIAARSTDADGYSLFTGPMHAGGWSYDVCLVDVYWNWGFSPMTASTGFGLHVNSPDINGDLVVDLLDVPPFAADYYESNGAFRSDLHRDGRVDLADIAVMATHIGARCQ